MTLRGEVNVPRARKTSAKIAKTASKLLRSSKSSAATKRVAGSALSQRAPKPRRSR